MRVLLVDRCDADSIWSVMTPASKALIEKGASVCWTRMMCPTRELRCRPPEGVEVRDIHVMGDSIKLSSMIQLLQFAPKFAALLKDWKPDIVHTHFAIPAMMARRVAKRMGLRVVSTQHELFGSMNPILRWGMRRSESCADAVTYVSKTVAESFGREARRLSPGEAYPDSRHVVIWNHIDFDEIQAATRNAPPPDPRKAVCVGRIEKVKGQRVAIAAWPRVLKEFPEMELHLIGAGPDEASLRKLRDELGLKNAVHFRGWLPKREALAEIASARLAIQPSDGTQEGFGLSLGEALVLGTQVLASDIPVFREVAGECTREIVFFAPNQPESLAAHCLETLRDGFTSNLEIVESFRKRFDSKVNADLFLSVYHRVMESKARTD